MEEFNVSYFLNLLNEVQLYDERNWIPALDNYHKQGTLNWVDFKQLHSSLQRFASKISEEWLHNVVSDITQETWHDFVGFLRNCQKLELDPDEISAIYQLIRK